MKVLDGKAGHLDDATEDSLTDKTKEEPNKESLELGLL
jgi:hypothetical protein